MPERGHVVSIPIPVLQRVGYRLLREQRHLSSLVAGFRKEALVPHLGHKPCHHVTRRDRNAEVRSERALRVLRLPTMSPQSNVETLARIVTALGDDTSRPEDIEWANEMPSGRDMLAWIASQLSAPEDAVHDDDDDDDDDILASLSAIALDDAELKLSG